MAMSGSVAGPPASRTHTRRSGFSLSRAARTQPAEPAPTMSTSKFTSAHAADQVTRLLRDHQHRGVDVAAHEVRHHRLVDDAQCLDPPEIEVGIDYRELVRVRAHAARAGRLVHGDRGVADVRVDVGWRALVIARQE